jgi:hypothetical protein
MLMPFNGLADAGISSLSMPADAIAPVMGGLLLALFVLTVVALVLGRETSAQPEVHQPKRRPPLPDELLRVACDDAPERLPARAA